MELCERCKKSQATFHMTNIDVSGMKQERHLCERCAIEEGLMQVAKQPVNINDLLESFLASGKAGASSLSNLVCEECGITYVEFRNHGLLGCPHDYDRFEEVLVKLLERAHDGATHHTGKAPKSLGAPRSALQDVRRLKRRLAEAVAAEDYERAAQLRDQIRQLEES
jgi:protein arginine kinase activator